MEDKLQWFTCPNCKTRISRPHPAAMDYVIEVIQCPKCLKLWDLRGGEPKEYERIPTDVRTRKV